ncbi:hypothetical protein Tco_1136038 [Tanacetum coccineum]
MDYQCTQAEEMERNRVHEETMQMLREMIKIQEEKRIFEEAARQEDEKRIAIEKEAAELEAKRKSQECLNIEEKSIPQASIRSRKSRIDPTLRNFTISTKRSLESSVKHPIPIPSEFDVISDGDCDDDYKKRFDLKVQQLWMPSIYDENNKIRECYMIRPSAITPDLPIPDSLIMEDENLDTILVTESGNTIKSSVEDLVPTPSEFADLSDGESKCDVPVGDESFLTFTTLSNPLFDSNDDFTSSDDESLFDEDVPKENFKIYSNPLFDEEIISTKIDPHCFNAESYLIESLLNRDTLIDSSPKFDYLLEEFSGELTHTDPIPPGVVDTDSEPEEEIRLAENLSYDNSSPRPPEERNSEIADTIVESLSLHLLSPLRIVTLLWRRSTYFLLPMTRCHRALRSTTMTRKGIFANGAQSSQVPVPLLDDPYEAIRQAYLVGMDTEPEPFEDHVKTETLESPRTIAPPTSLPNSTPPTLVPILYRTARMVVRVPPAMSPGLSTSIAEVVAMSDSAFLEDDEEEEDEEEEDDKEEDEEIEESLDSDSASEDTKDEGPTIDDEDPAAGDEGLAVGDEGPGMGVESLGLEGDEAVPEGQQRAASVVETVVGEPLGLGYETLRRWEIALGEGQMPSVFEVGQSSGFIPEFERPERVSALRQPTLTTWIDPKDVGSPEGLIRDHTVRLGELSLALFERSLEHEQERVAKTFRAIWRPVLALESWAVQTDAQRAALWYAISDTQIENQELRLQIAEERRARLDLAEIVDSMRRGRSPEEMCRIYEVWISSCVYH